MKTNREYFSYSQLSTWESSKKEFWKRYGLGIVPPPTKYQQFGSKFMQDLEFDRNIPLNIPIEGLIEHKIFTSLNAGTTGITLLAILDSVSSDLSRIIEYKTGKVAWTQDMVDNNTQLLFYSTVVYLSKGIVPTCRLVWVETEDGQNGEIRYTGNVTTFDMRPIAPKDIKAMIRRISEAVFEIEEFEYVDANIDEDIAAKYRSLVDERNRIEAELELLKSDIMLRLVEAKTDYSETDAGNFSLAKRTTYSYSDEIKEQETALKSLKVQEELTGIAKPKTTSYIIFKPKK